MTLQSPQLTMMGRTVLVPLLGWGLQGALLLRHSGKEGDGDVGRQFIS